ncbi:MAG: DNA-protecting protein DprA, partial [Clostridiales Family XIII bacterium]|nr:DNA-protecting protein DprA [Clostridiales Family XIII bacterium]
MASFAPVGNGAMMDASRTVGNGAKMGASRTVGLKDAGYPVALKSLNDPPDPLRYIGDLSVLEKPCVAIVGSRKATDYGRWATMSLARKLSEHGVVVVSGMAEGIDSFAHRGALEGPT